MSAYYRRTTPGTRENLAAALVAAGLAVGMASISFYLVRIFLAREPLVAGRRSPDGEQIPSSVDPSSPEAVEDGL
jgi:hypothetical protein